MTLFAALVGAAVLVPAAAAATPADIARDLADGRLDGTYTRAELEAYMRDAMVQGYGQPELPPVAGVAGVAGAQSPPAAAAGVAGEQSPLGETAEVGVLPFTGLDLALLAFGGALLLLLGFGARKLGRRQR